MTEHSTRLSTIIAPIVQILMNSTIHQTGSLHSMPVMRIENRYMDTDRWLNVINFHFLLQ